MTQNVGPFSQSNMTLTVRLLSGVVAVVAVITLILQPRMQLSISPKERERRIVSFVSHIRSARSVNLKEFWQLRDEYGYNLFFLSPDHITYRETQELIAPVLKMPLSTSFEFANMHGERLESHDYLFSWWPWQQEPQNFKAILDRISKDSVGSNKLIFQDEDTRVFLQDNNHLTVAFVAPLEQIATVYGLFDWTDQKQRSFKNYYFANTTTFTLDCCQTSIGQLIEKH